MLGEHKIDTSVPQRLLSIQNAKRCALSDLCFVAMLARAVSGAFRLLVCVQANLKLAMKLLGDAALSPCANSIAANSNACIY